MCTIEKVNALINSMLSSPISKKNQGFGIMQLGCVVVDELHMMGDCSRGYLLEILIRYYYCLHLFVLHV